MILRRAAAFAAAAHAGSHLPARLCALRNLLLPSRAGTYVQDADVSAWQQLQRRSNLLLKIELRSGTQGRLEPLGIHEV